MTKALVISNLHAPDCFGGYEMVASECMDILEKEHGWKISCYCANSGRARNVAYPARVKPELTGYFPRGWTHHHALLPATRHLKENTDHLVKKLKQEAVEADVTLLFNPRRLSTLQWLPALEASRNVVAWVSDYWPTEYPDCDKLWQAAQSEKIAWSPMVMAGAAKVRQFYGDFRPSHNDLRHIRKAAFVSEFVMKKNAPFFPNLEEAVVIRNGIDHSLFPFKEMTPVRWNTWGFCGRIQKDKGVELALSLFEKISETRGELRFLLAGDVTTTYGNLIKKRIKESPILREKVTILGKVSRDKLARDFYHKVGILLFTSQWDEPFSLTVLEAMSCGTLVVATDTGGTSEVVNQQTGLLCHFDDIFFKITQLINKEEHSFLIRNAAIKSAEFTMSAMGNALVELSL